MSELTKEERKWLNGVQKALNKPGSGRVGFYTTGDDVLTVYNTDFDDEIDEIQDAGTTDMCHAAEKVGANFDYLLSFPSSVHSTAG